jgi:lipoprotein-anchoring transpeptidase ErfK/SrfK
MAKRFVRFLILVSVTAAVAGCSTVSDFVSANLPERHEGRASVVVKLRQQEAYLYRRGYLTASSRISSGREGYRTPIGRFHVIQKDEDHHSGIYGDYVDASGEVIRANVDVRKDAKPSGTRFIGTPMPYYIEFRPSYGLHAGYLPGAPASHGCIRMPYWKARQFYRAIKIGTRVTIKP